MKKFVVVLLCFLFVLSACEKEPNKTELEIRLENAEGFERDYVEHIIAFDEKVMKYEIGAIIEIESIDFEEGETTIFIYDAMNRIIKEVSNENNMFEVSDDDVFMYEEEGSMFELHQYDDAWVRLPIMGSDFAQDAFEDFSPYFEGVEGSEVEVGTRYETTMSYDELVDLAPEFEGLFGMVDDEYEIGLIVEYHEEADIIAYYEYDFSEMYTSMLGIESSFLMTFEFIEFLGTELTIPEVDIEDDYADDLLSVFTQEYIELEGSGEISFNLYGIFDQDYVHVLLPQGRYRMDVEGLEDGDDIMFTFYDEYLDELGGIHTVELEEPHEFDLPANMYIKVFVLEGEASDKDLVLTFEKIEE